MQTTIDLDPEAYRKAEALAAERGVTVGKVLGDALLDHIREAGSDRNVEVDDEGWPVLRFGHPLTLEEAEELVEED